MSEVPNFIFPRDPSLNPVAFGSKKFMVGGTTLRSLADRLAGMEVNLADFGGVMDGRNNRAALVAATAFVDSIGGGTVRIPIGESLLNGGTVIKPSRVKWVGGGRNASLFKKTDNLGDMIQCGTSGGDQSSHISGIGFFHSYNGTGAGFTLPTSASEIIYPMTTGSILSFPNGPYRGEFTDLWLIGGRAQITIRGGANSIFTSVDTAGVYDSDVAGMQLSPSGIRADPGPYYDFATNITLLNCCLGGTITPAISPGVYPTSNWPGGVTSTDTPKNIGPLNILDITACESFTVLSGYFGSANKHNIRFRPTIHPLGGFYSLSGISVDGTFLDSAHLGIVGVENPDGGQVYNVKISPADAVCQNNGWSGYYEGDAANSGIAAVNVTWLGPIRATVGPCVYSVNGRNVDFSGAALSGYNGKGLYTAAAYTTGRNCAAWFGAGSVACKAKGSAGGNGAYGADTKTVYGIATSVPLEVNTAGLQDTGCATSLRAGFHIPAEIRGELVNFTLTPMLNGLDIEHLGVLTGSITVTLSNTNAQKLADRIYPLPLKARVVRSSTGAFNLTIAGVTSKVLTAAGQVVEFTWYPGNGWRQSGYWVL